MTITTMQVQGSDGVRRNIPLEQGGEYDTPIHALPTGAATASRQDTANEILAAIEGVVATQATLADILTKLAGGLPAALGAGGGLKVDGSGTALPIIAAALPLPSGGATSANQTELIANVGDVTDAKVQTDANGSVLGFLRGIVSWFAGLIGPVAQTPAQATALRVQIGPGDVISYLPVVVDYPHHQVHEGEAFIFSDLQTAGLNINLTRDIRVSVGALAPTTHTPHLILEFIASDQAEIELYEGTTWTSGGTAQVGYNRNRNVADDSGTLFVNGATALTVNAIGTAVWKGLTLSNKSAAGGTDRGTYEFVLKPSTEYCVRVTSRVNGLKFLTRLEYYKDLGV